MINWNELKLLPLKNPIPQLKKAVEFLCIFITYPSGNDNTSDNRNKSEIGKPTLPLRSHETSKNRSEKRRGGPNSLSKRHWKIA